jgi:hypothetical protein
LLLGGCWAYNLIALHEHAVLAWGFRKKSICLYSLFCERAIPKYFATTFPDAAKVDLPLSDCCATGEFLGSRK